jgi:hypothetical protein
MLKSSLFLLFLLAPLEAYIDIELAVVTSAADVCLNMPMNINNLQYHIAVSLHQQQDIIVAPSALPHKKKASSTKPAKEGQLHVWSL